MSRPKRTSRVLKHAELRAAGLASIDPNINFGDACNLENMNQLMEQLRKNILAYNSALSVIDSSRTQIKQLEKTLGDLSERMLTGVACKYGKDSNEYEMAGGVRKSNRVRKSTATRLKGTSNEISTDEVFLT
ncbi:hypothetical protein AMR41_13320 [Hapalosiphon sp. MRB220]|nr:hypothetical protein AMR41_13320 [Hapalosiphon sp. MRB220]